MGRKKNSSKSKPGRPQKDARKTPAPDSPADIKQLKQDFEVTNRVLELLGHVTEQDTVDDICRTIVEGQGGHLRAENRPEGGARISFWLPLGRED